MDLTRLLIQILIAIACGTIASVLIPRRIPGKFLGLILIGFAGVWLGEWTLNYLDATYTFPIPAFVTWEFQGVPVFPSIVGSAIILYGVTTLVSWSHSQR
jgi:uncharacterized membrane protein YeaQ/YmgE (transglycosylase-associated protein family)